VSSVSRWNATAVKTEADSDDTDTSTKVQRGELNAHSLDSANKYEYHSCAWDRTTSVYVLTLRDDSAGQYSWVDNFSTLLLARSVHSLVRMDHLKYFPFDI